MLVPLPVPRVLPLLLAGLLLAGCTGGLDETAGGDGGASTGGVSAPPPAGENADNAVTDTDTSGGAETSGGGGRSGGTGDSLARVVPADRSLVRTGRMTVRVEDLGVASRRAGDLVRAAGGEVYAEETDTGGGEDGRTGSSALTLKVPPDALEPLLADLARLGRVLDRGLTTEDVTEQVTDIESRLATQRTSVARVRALLAQAKSVGEVVAVEAELAEREGALESLQARSRALAGQVAMSTVDLRLVGPDAEAPEADHERGFLVGLEHGWDAFLGAGAVALTVLGALLPFLVAAAAVATVALPLRARRRRPVQPAA